MNNWLDLVWLVLQILAGFVLLLTFIDTWLFFSGSEKSLIDQLLKKLLR